jgi:Zn-dependent protease/CBS domain-containing protein
MHGSFKLGTIKGIQIRLHYTWLLAFFLIAWSLAQGYFPMADRSAEPGAYWLLGALGALLLFASVLVHELGHSLVAGTRGLRVDNITLFIFGGVSSITREPSTARDEFLIAVVGPVTSLVLAGVFWGIATLLPVGSSTSAVARYLGYTNLLLGLFNIVPGFPLDGGRVLRSIVWGLSGSMVTATRIASYVGQAVAFLLIAWGVIDVVSGDLFGGLWIAFIGWFLNSGAEASRQEIKAQSALAGVPVSTIMQPSPDAVAPEVTVSEFVLEHALRRGQRALPVVSSGQLVGIMSITDAKHLRQEAWATTPVGDVMTHRPLKTLGPDADLAAALQLMADADIHQVLIVREGAVVGMVNRADIMRYLHSGLASSTPAERGPSRQHRASASITRR